MVVPGVPIEAFMRFTNLQLIRLGAALVVVVLHSAMHAVEVLGVPPGDVSFLMHRVLLGFPVPLFFAVSGVVLTHAARTARGGYSAPRFLLARFLRLFPGYWLALVVALLVSAAGLLSPVHKQLVPHVNFGTFTLWPNGARSPLFLGVEWTMLYEVFLSVALCGLALFGRRVWVAVVVWLAVLAVRAAVAPGYGTHVLPHWKSIGVSAFVIPFLFGILAYELRDRGRQWVVAAVVGWCLVFGSARFATIDAACWNWGVAAGGAVWLAMRLPQVSAENRLVRLADASYGLFLIHVPVILAVLYAFARAGVLVGRAEGAVIAGAVAVFVGVAFGRIEWAMYLRLRPIGKWTAADVRAKLTFRRPRLARAS